MSLDSRPDPDRLLARVTEAERPAGRGRLKLFFGAVAGVGKTYAMLEAARELVARGQDVVVGWVETHGRVETERLLDGLERLPPAELAYKGITLRELDLDGALARRPAVLLVDELAHTNAPGSRHEKRWQDVEELLAAGIDVWSTLNVQHVESLNDVVAQVTAVVVRETVPDAVIERADEIELIDLPADDLLRRLREGKVYLGERADRALAGFFRKGNLIALRELALRLTAQRVEGEMQAWRARHEVDRTWPVAERILVAVSPSRHSLRLVRGARRLAARLGAEWIAVWVEPSSGRAPTAAERERVWQTLRLAEQLGAEVVHLTGASVARELLKYARLRNVSKIVVGRPARPRWLELLIGSAREDLLRAAESIDVYVISGEAAEEPPRERRTVARGPRRRYLWAALACAGTTGLGALLFGRVELTNLVMLYLLGVVAIALRWGRGPSILASVLSVAAFDFFFVPPYLTFAVSDTEYLLTFTVMLLVALVISTLTTQLKRQAEISATRERRTAALYALSRDLASSAGRERILASAVEHISSVFQAQVLVLLPGPQGRLEESASEAYTYRLDAREEVVAEWVLKNGRPAGATTATLPAAKGLYLPLRTPLRTLGVLGLHPASSATVVEPEQMQLLETFANQLALALER